MPKNNALTILVTFILLASVAAWIRPDPAGAAIALKGEVKVEDVYNPNPAEGDLPLPMPCDLFMVFKAVSLPVTGSVRDYESFFGLDTQTENAFLENRHQVHLGSDLSVANLPQGLAEIASRALSQASTDQIYLIGKYEVTKGQWDAVMGDGKCAMDSKSARPIAEISYFQAESFAERYMAWLIANRPEVLPRYQGRGDSVGLVRLPTEEEWEYAARGGHEVSTDKIATQDFFDVPRDVDHRQYGLFSAAGYNNETEPGNIGRWKPNPLGLYDTAGNVSEMIASPFKMIKHKRVHGSAGGFVSKG
ncbi:MAG: formylglycine-generating enzyme family protein, partial [Deltaproteobacteria bacterium]|nr:formylglycine-generating enzyme family protein [Deltaproteobacteria bacterium]